MSEEVYERIGRCGLVSTIVLDDVANAVPLAKALIAGGMDIMELTLRTDAAYESLKVIKKEVPEMLLGVGTVLNVEQLESIAEIGVDFAVSPGLNPEVVAHASEIGMPFAPGICTPSDIEKAISLGCKVLKFFPAEACGGLKYLQNMAAPYRHLGLKYIPLGGINNDNLGDYLTSDLILAAGGSWLAPGSAIANQDWDGITATTKQAIDKIESIRNNDE